MSEDILPRFRRVAAAARLFVADDFIAETEVPPLIAAVEAALAAGGAVNRSEAGVSCEVPLDADNPAPAALHRRIERALGFANACGWSLRFRRYAPGEFHPPHHDVYQIDGEHLIATAMLWLEDTEAGGETLFEAAGPDPILLEPRSRRLAVWFNIHPDGTPDPTSWHEGLPVRRGSKTTLTAFFYGRPDQVPGFVPAPVPETEIPGVRRGPPPASHTSLVCIDDGVPEVTLALLRAACATRGISFKRIDAAGFAFHEATPLPAGTLLYRPAISVAAMRVEQALWAPGVATFHAEPDGMFFASANFNLLFARAGLPMPRSFPIGSTDRDTLRGLVASVGGLPVVVKVLGYSRGIGTMRADSLPALFSLVDYLLAQGVAPFLCEFIDRAVHWRVTVIGDRAVAAYRNVQEEDDFRTYGSEDPVDFTATVPDALAAVAVGAVRALRLEFGGVDILEAPDGRLYLLEANYPCFFAQAQTVAGIDIAGMMVDHLLGKLAAAPTT